MERGSEREGRRGAGRQKETAREELLRVQRPVVLLSLVPGAL